VRGAENDEGHSFRWVLRWGSGGGPGYQLHSSRHLESRWLVDFECKWDCVSIVPITNLPMERVSEKHELSWVDDDVIG